MNRFKKLHRYPRAILILLAAMTLVFTALYLAASARKGFLYQDALLLPKQTEGGVVYAGTVQGQPARFTVYADRTVLFQCGERTYGPYAARKAPDAVPPRHEAGGQMTGVELYCGEALVFRGGVLESGGRLLLYNQDGTLADPGVTAVVNGGAAQAIITDGAGNVIDPLEPSAHTILTLMAGPVLRHKGAWPLWGGGVLLCALTAVSILFADELFRLDLALRIRNADRAEPSDWALAGRCISWTALPVAALVLFLAGLR